jgi:hypothetical protein
MRTRRTAAGAIAAATLTLAMAGTASADIYWAAEGTDTIGHANNAGDDVEAGFIGGAGVATDPTGVAINGTHIYWSHDAGAGGSIGRDAIEGSASPTATLIATNGDPQGVSLDAANVYWTHAFGSPTPAGWVGRGSLGGFVPTSFGQAFQPTADTSQCGVAANGDRSFWANPGSPGSIGSAHGVDEPDQNYIPSAASDPCGIAMTTGLVYWTNRGGASGTIGRATLTGTGAVPALVDTGVGSDPCGIAVTGAHIYWTDPVSDDIGRADLDGTDVDSDFIDLAAGTDPCGIAASPTQSAAPSSHDFGALTVGSESDIVAFSIGNTASSVLDVTSVTLMGPNAGQFDLTGEGCSPSMTSPGLNCFVNAGYSPTAVGTHNAFLRVVSNASNSPTDIPLSGAALAPPPLDPPAAAPPDAAPPDTTIDEGPSGKTKSKSATFGFGGSDVRAVVSFECKLDEASFDVCSSPKTYSALKKGSHTFSVRAVDAAGNVDATPATRSWTVKKKKKKK